MYVYADMYKYVCAYCTYAYTYIYICVCVCVN